MDAHRAQAQPEGTHPQSLSFKEVKETWGSEYEITEGQYKGYRLRGKILLSRVYETGKTDEDGLPVFDVSFDQSFKVHPPLHGFRRRRKR